jgi:mannose-1-phosphate guanylyltransferase
MLQTDNFYALVMAGGSGTRLWPKSRENSPKQFQKIFGNQTLFQQTVARITKVVPTERIFVATGDRYRTEVLRQVPALDPNNIIVEPFKRNTAPAMGLAALYIVRLNPQAVVMTSPSDHVVLKENQFIQKIRAAFVYLVKNPRHFLTIGVQPTYAETGYGYIRAGQPVALIDGQKVLRADHFVEKPDQPTADRYFQSKKYLWNASYFAWRADYLLELFKKHQPIIYRGLIRIDNAIGTKQEQAVIVKEFKKFPDLPIDIAIAEKTDRIVVLPADWGWSDIGSWAAVYDHMKLPGEANYVEGHYVGIDTQNCLIHGADRMIATVGIEDLVIVDSGDVILIAHKNRSQDVKKVIEKLKEEGQEHFL